MKCLVDAHINHLKFILSQNKDAKNDENVWKVLIYDQFSQDMFATLFKIGQLRDENVTLHLKLSSERQKVFCVNTIYVCQPTTENVDQIIKDLDQNLYNSIYIHFTHPIEAAILKRLAQGIEKNKSIACIKDIFHHTIHFITLSSNMFTLGYRNIFSQTALQQMDGSLIHQIAFSIFSACKCLKINPKIIYKGKNANKVSDFLLSVLTHNDFSELSPDQEDGLIILFERECDIPVMLLHSWHYGHLISDILEINNNKIILKDENNKSTKFYSFEKIIVDQRGRF